MPSDLELIKELEKELGVSLKEGEIDPNSFNTYTAVFKKDSKGQVTHVGLDRLELKKIPGTVFKFRHLEFLTLFANKLSTVPSEIKHLTNLKILLLDTNKISSIPSDIKYLTNLKIWYLFGNKLSRLPPEITQLKKLQKLDLKENPLKQPPPEIAFAEDNIEKIRNYFAELEAQGEDYIYEAKLILVGEPGAGKTSLAKKLMNPKYKLSPTEQMTKGIDVAKWKFPYSKEIPFQCNIWDFGGQDIMHATHRYFLTKRSLYIVVADNRKEDIDFYYWMNILELLSGKSPVLIVLNEKFDFKKSVPEDIVKAFESVKKVFNINLANNAGLSDLSRAIQKSMCNLPHVGKDPIPKKWVSIRKELETDKRNFITLSDYLEICKNNDVEDEEKAGYISEFLHDLGVILHFQKDRILRNTIILNTRWATEAVYQVLFDNTVIKHAGEFNNSDLGRIWKQAHYKDKHAELLQLMLNFELCYEIGNSQKYIIPDLLPDKSSADKVYWEKQKKVLHFEYRYDFMPKGIISRLIVRMNKFIHKKQQWKNGVVLKNGDSLAEIVETFDKRVLKIRITGNDRQDALAVIRKEVKELHDTFDLAVKEMVPCNCEECKKSEAPNFFDFDELKQYKNEGEKFIKCRIGKLKNVNVLDLISDILIKEDLDEKGASERGVIVNVNQNQNVQQTNTQTQEVKQDVKQSVHVEIDIKVELPAIQKEFADLKEALANANPKLEKELDKIEDSLDEVTAEDEKKALKKPMNKMLRFLEKVADEKSDFHKAIKGAKKGIQLAQKVGKTYNKFAPWLALPIVPPLLLGNQDK